MEERRRKRWRFLAAGLLLAAAAIVLRRVWAALLVQLAAGFVLMGCALPLCRRLERRTSPGAAAALSLAGMLAAAAATVALLTPLLVRQMAQLRLDGAILWLQGAWDHLEGWLQGHGIDTEPLRAELFTRLPGLIGGVAEQVASRLAGAARGLAKLLLAPLRAFYFLRDRKRLCVLLALLLPVERRAQGVRAAREMKRETAAYLRGQLLLCASVGALTAVALLLTGTPGWLPLGLLMGVMEVIPYAGPLLAGAPAVLLSLGNGLVRALWTTAALVGVQQVEGSFLSPRLLGGATRMHPALVLLLVSAGGLLGGAWGMMLALPAAVALRGAVRGWRL